MSEISTYLCIFLRIFDDLEGMHPKYNRKESSLDRAYLLGRVRSEGDSILTKTLPALGKHFESALETGTFTPVSFFKKEKGRTTPAFMRIWFKEIFDENGVLLDTACGIAVRAIRQVCYFMYKLESDYPADLVAKVIKDFCEVDQELTHCENLDREQGLIVRIAGFVLGAIFRDFDPGDIVPRPGPGASASGTHRSQRYEPLRHYRVVHEQYPYYRYFFVGSDHLLDRADAYRAMPRYEAAASVLRLVPKDSRGPRIICMEEQEYMFLQQGLGDALRTHMESHPLTRGHVNFRNQEVNRDLAWSSSLDRRYATLDMKEASDRISKALVEKLFFRVPKLSACLQALSTPQIRLPDGGVLDAKKFAPMGSSLCFPIMSVVHYALGLACMHVRTARPVKALAKEIYVYGDDIIVETQHVASLFELFPKFGLKFNQGKSFVQGHFRESCGLDAFKGTNVTPQRLKSRFFDSQDPNDLCSVFAMHHNLRSAGFVQTARVLKTILESRHGEFPAVCEGSEVLGWISHPAVVNAQLMGIGPHLSLRVTSSDALMHQQVKCRVIETRADSSMCGGWEQLVRALVHTAKGSERLDGRFSRKLIRFKRVPIDSLFGASSRWLPKREKV
jgi:hypothetical protein